MARLKPDFFSADLFLLGTSQDQYTLFTGLYARLIDLLGLGTAAGLMVAMGQLAIASSCWWIVRSLFSARAAWFALGFFIIIPAHYGAFHIFKVAEEFLTARLPAEALCLGSLALFLRDRRAWSFIAAIAAAAMHPLVATPYLIILALLTVPETGWPILIASGIAVLLAVVTCAYLVPVGPISIMDSQWLEVVHARSIHLFITDWPARDWQQVALTFTTLALAFMASPPHGPLRKLISATVLVGVAGLLLTLLSAAAPISLLMMGQPWRWLWPAAVLAILLVYPTARATIERAVIGRAVAALLLSGWICVDLAGGTLGATSAALWGLRDRIPQSYHRYVFFLGISVVGITLAWAIADATQVASLQFTTNVEPTLIERLRNILSLPAPGLLTAALLSYLIMNHWRKPTTTIVVLASIALLGSVLPRMLSTLSNAPFYEKFLRERVNFAQWQQLIPPNTNVLWYDNNIASWMLLERPSYLSRSASAGVVFSREGALEARRRAQSLNPYIDAKYMIDGVIADDHEPIRELTLPLLRHICSDPKLGFVVSNTHLGFGIANRSTNPEFSDAQLYNCQRIPTQS